jgi:hypothetical protein
MRAVGVMPSGDPLLVFCADHADTQLCAAIFPI